MDAIEKARAELQEWINNRPSWLEIRDVDIKPDIKTIRTSGMQLPTLTLDEFHIHVQGSTTRRLMY